MSLYSDPPSLREFRFDKPSLLVCWWITIFCTMIIFFRVVGRFIRTERLFPEDKIAASALIPLYIRMSLVHFVLMHGTNNADFTGVNLSEEEIRLKEIASGMVLASRIFYAATLWILKYSVLEFLGRLTMLSWERFHHSTMSIFRWTLAATFAAVIISDFVECQPFDHYWQVLPDPGGRCRQGYAQMLTMAACNVLTDIMLAVFPIPLIVGSHLTIKKKVQLILLFSLGISVVGVTLYRVPRILREDGRQQYRSLLASVELLFATASSNSLVLGSFVRDRGLKKQKARRQSLADSFDRPHHLRRPALQRYWGSDEDLVRDMGFNLGPEHRDRQYSLGDESLSMVEQGRDDPMRWGALHRQRSHAERSDDSLLSRDQMIGGGGASTPPRKISFMDIGGLLGDPKSPESESSMSQPRPIASLPASSNGVLRGSTAILQDIGGLLSPTRDIPPRSGRRAHKTTELHPIPREIHEARHRARGNEPVLMDIGGLLK
ncbi:hypothetical protein B0I35DRAFT_403706 [Stachybotrys elegans]|uniref:Rhodopsin domain-containing protein n=1 Tax=Stachybotrys elegans TaxID=80388 RepID=A0A8K0T3T1_9HYPO|nr:hypothetical protein B0I35DRAFT_403706 [Stachybotrys elegans]